MLPTCIIISVVWECCLEASPCRQEELHSKRSNIRRYAVIQLKIRQLESQLLPRALFLAALAKSTVCASEVFFSSWNARVLSTIRIWMTSELPPVIHLYPTSLCSGKLWPKREWQDSLAVLHFWHHFFISDDHKCFTFNGFRWNKMLNCNQNG